MDENPYRAPQAQNNPSPVKRDYGRVAAIIAGVAVVGSMLYTFYAMWDWL
jgi:hypothetical protein